MNTDSIVEKLKEIISQKLNVTEIVDKIDDAISEKITSSDFIENVVGKSIDVAKNKLQNYLYMGGLLYAILVILLLFIIYLLYKKK